MATNCMKCGVKLACLGWRTCDSCDKKEKDRKLALKIKKLNQLAEKKKKKKKEEVVLTQTRKYNIDPENLAGFFHCLRLLDEPNTETKKIVRQRDFTLCFKITERKHKILVCDDCGEKYLKPLGCLLCKHYHQKLQEQNISTA